MNTKKINMKKIEHKKEHIQVDELLEQEEILHAIAENIVKYREKHNLSQLELAEKLDMNETMIQKLESGRYNPTFKQIHKISRELTDSSKLFKNVLEEISSNLKKITNSELIHEQINKGTNDISYLYTNSHVKNEIVYLERYNNIKGEEIYGQYKSKDTING